MRKLPKIAKPDRLIHLVESDTTAPATAEPLLLLLAEEWAGKDFTDPSTAYTALRGALQAAADLKAQGALPSNSSAQLQAVLRRVSDLNDAGLPEDADAELEQATRRNRAEAQRNAAEAEALFEAQLKQDRLRNRPKATAERLIAHLKATAPPGGVFRATDDVLVEWKERGEQMGDPFDLAVALDLARLNHARAKGPQLGQALLSLGNCHRALGERQLGGGHLTRAMRAYTDALKEFPRKQQPENWATTQNNLGNALQTLGAREGDSARLHAAIAAYTAALTVYTPEAAPMDWAMTQNNLGNALQALGEREGDSARPARRHRRLHRRADRPHARGRSDGLGHDAEQPRQRSERLGRARGRQRPPARRHRRLHRRADRLHARGRTDGLGHDAA